MWGPVELTSEEIITLAYSLELPIPGFMPGEVIREWSKEVRDSIVMIGRRSLKARRLFRESDPGNIVPPELVELMETACLPGLVARTQVISPQLNSLVLFLSSPARTIAHRNTPLGNHVMTMFESERLLGALLAAANIMEPSLEPRATESTAQPRRINLTKKLSSGDYSVAEVAVTYPESPTVTIGETLTWVSDSEGEYFLIEKDESDKAVFGTECDPSDLPRLLRRLLPRSNSAVQEVAETI